MKGIKLFIRFMITLLIVLNAFVYMSMRNFSFDKILLSIVGLISASMIVHFMISYLQKSRRKKTIQDSQLISKN